MTPAESRVLGVIPARLASSRLPGKVLRDIAGRPMIWHVWDGARRSPAVDDVLVATDSDEVMRTCAGLGIPAMLTSSAHPSGTDRVWEVSRRRPAAMYVNIQGDEPLVTAGHLDRLVAPFREHPETQVSTLCIRATAEELPKPSVNKVVRDAQGRALYFSKHPIPYDRDGVHPIRYKHVGLYAYRGEALHRFHGLPPSPLERAECLEQLRFLENGIPIVVMETDEPTIGVDTEEDLRAVEAILSARAR
jgi:3-deoxy-manno-octulosonate cytidylyltransferase (CMP-KDO synthetase)